MNINIFKDDELTWISRQGSYIHNQEGFETSHAFPVRRILLQDVNWIAPFSSLQTFLHKCAKNKGFEGCETLHHSRKRRHIVRFSLVCSVLC